MGEHRFSIAHKRKMQELDKPYEEQKKTESHRRKYYLLTGTMPSDEQDEDEIGEEKPFTSLEHMSMIHRAKDLHEKASKSKSIRVDEDIKKEKAVIVETLLKNEVFKKLDVETTIKCTTCSVKLQGQKG